MARPRLRPGTRAAPQQPTSTAGKPADPRTFRLRAIGRPRRRSPPVRAPRALVGLPTERQTGPRTPAPLAATTEIRQRATVLASADREALYSASKLQDESTAPVEEMRDREDTILRRDRAGVGDEEREKLIAEYTRTRPRLVSPLRTTRPHARSRSGRPGGGAAKPVATARAGVSRRTAAPTQRRATGPTCHRADVPAPHRRGRRPARRPRPARPAGARRPLHRRRERPALRAGFLEAGAAARHRPVRDDARKRPRRCGSSPRSRPSAQCPSAPARPAASASRSRSTRRSRSLERVINPLRELAPSRRSPRTSGGASPRQA